MSAPVVIAGAGPNGLMLARELGLARIRPLVLERRVERSREPRANGVIGQTVQLLDHRGLYQRLSQVNGRPRTDADVHLRRVAVGIGPSRREPARNRDTTWRLEQVLEERARELGAEIRRGHELVAFSQHGDNVTLRVHDSDGAYEIRTRYPVGCDGGRSTVRKNAGIAFPGVTSTEVVSRTAHVMMPRSRVVTETVPELKGPGLGRIGLYAWHRTEHGAYAVMPLGSGEVSVSSIEWDTAEVNDDSPMTMSFAEFGEVRVDGWVGVPIQAPSRSAQLRLQVSESRRTRQFRRPF